MATTAVQLEITKQNIGILTISRPQVRNAMDWDTMDQFSRHVEALHSLSSIRVLIITGAGKSFIAGGDLKALHRSQTASEGFRLSSIMTHALARLETLPVPVIAAINGSARGGGAEIALACDIRIIEEQADFGFVQINLGISPGWGAGQRLLHLAGYSLALEWLSTGVILSPADMLNFRLVNQVVPTGKSLQAAIQLGGIIASKPANAVKAVKDLLQSGLNFHPQTAAAHEQSLFPALWASEEHNKAVDAFINKKSGSS